MELKSLELISTFVENHTSIKLYLYKIDFSLVNDNKKVLMDLSFYYD